MKTRAQVLRQAAKLVRKQWQRGSIWNGLWGEKARFCAMGAIVACSSRVELSDPVKNYSNRDQVLGRQTIDALARHGLEPDHTIAYWNDHIAANAEEVAAKMECVADALDSGVE